MSDIHEDMHEDMREDADNKQPDMHEITENKIEDDGFENTEANRDTTSENIITEYGDDTEGVLEEVHEDIFEEVCEDIKIDMDDDDVPEEKTVEKKADDKTDADNDVKEIKQDDGKSTAGSKDIVDKDNDSQSESHDKNEETKSSKSSEYGFKPQPNRNFQKIVRKDVQVDMEKATKEAVNKYLQKYTKGKNSDKGVYEEILEDVELKGEQFDKEYDDKVEKQIMKRKQRAEEIRNARVRRRKVIIAVGSIILAFVLIYAIGNAIKGSSSGKNNKETTAVTTAAPVKTTAVKETTAPPTTAQKVMYTTDVLNLRKESSADATLVTQIPEGKAVTVLATNGEWTQVKYDKYTGFVKTEYLKEKK